MEHIKKLSKLKLFEGFSSDDIVKILSCSAAKKKKYYKGEIIIKTGDSSVCACVILQGSVEAAEETVDGEKHIIVRHESGDLFGEILMSAEDEKSPVTVYATENCEILTFDNRILSLCSKACPCHAQFVTNLLKMTARKYWRLYEKVKYLSIPTLRLRIIAFLSDIKAKNPSQSNSFEIQFSREEMASYLNVNRTSLSRELSAMKEDGILNFYKNKFELYL